MRAGVRANGSAVRVTTHVVPPAMLAVITSTALMGVSWAQLPVDVDATACGLGIGRDHRRTVHAIESLLEGVSTAGLRSVESVPVGKDGSGRMASTRTGAAHRDAHWRLAPIYLCSTTRVHTPVRECAQVFPRWGYGPGRLPEWGSPVVSSAWGSRTRSGPACARCGPRTSVFGFRQADR